MQTGGMAVALSSAITVGKLASMKLVMIWSATDTQPQLEGGAPLVRRYVSRAYTES